MSADLGAEVRTILGNLPCSVEMPAGTGKTQLIVAMAGEAALAGERSLILTHTNAGVDALRRRLRGRVDQKFVHVDTITGWAIDLVRHYPALAQVVVPAVVDAADSSLYVLGAARVAAAPAIIRMHQASFRYLFVDEYQDCTTEHHAFVHVLSKALPHSAILGDPLQGIFDFDGALVDWAEHVRPLYPDYAREHIPWRWRGHNDALGEWLLDIRSQFRPGGTLDFSALSVPGLEWKQLTPENEINAAYSVLRREGSVVLLHQVRAQHKTIGLRTRGAYSIMESLRGDYMHDQLTKLQSVEPTRYAYWLAETAKSCFSGLGDVDRQTVLGRLARNASLQGLKRPNIPETIAALEAVRVAPALATLSQAMYRIAGAEEGHCYAHEAWFDMARAIGQAAVDQTRQSTDHLIAIRNRLRYTGRQPRKALLSRTVLVKGLEYDHVVVANADAIGDHKDLYVALTRPRKTLTVLSASPVITLT